MDANLMQTALTQLDQALASHEEWSEKLIRTLICRLPFDDREVPPGDHQHCRFGQWYYGPGAATLHGHPGFSEIAVEHQRVHELAAALLESSAENGQPSPDEFEGFAAVLKRMRLETLTLQRELADALRNLDPLTGTQTRTTMLPFLREQLQMVRCGLHSCVVAMLDIDHFKQVNDEHGHCSGDKVLKTFAHQVIENLMPQERIFRFGGEEFLLCIPATDIARGTALLEKIRTTFASTPFTFGEGAPFGVTASVGMTMLDPAESVETAIDRADRALYCAKAGGRNQVKVWTAGMV